MRGSLKRVIIFFLFMILGVLSIVRIMYVNEEQHVRQTYTYKVGETFEYRNFQIRVEKVDIYSADDMKSMYKEIPETAGPCYYDCPQSILNLLSPCSEIEDYRDWAKEWRKKCVKQRKITLAKRNHLSLKVSWLKEERKLVWTPSGKRGFYTDGVYRYSSRYLNANNVVEVDGKPV